MTGSYEVTVKESVRRNLRRIPRRDLESIDGRILKLRANPRPPGCEKLAGGLGYRIRQGDYRILYTIDDDAKVVDVYKVGHRREVYR